MPRKKLTGKAKSAFVSKMARGKAAKKRGTTKRKTSRKRNPSVKSITRTAKPLLITSAGVLGGAFLGYKAADLADRYLISRLPAGAVQGLGWIAACVAALYGGKKLAPKAKDLPIIAGSIALCVPFALGAFQSVGLVPLGLAAAEPPPDLPPEEPGAEGWRYTKRIDPRGIVGGRTGMSGRLLSGRAPGSPVMAGTLHRGRAPGTQVMAGWFGEGAPSREMTFERASYAQPI